MAERETKTLRNGFLAFVYVLFALWGVRLVVSPDSSGLDTMFAALIAIAVVVSCIYDSRIVKKTFPQSVQALMLFSWPLSAPVYLMWSRGLKRGAVLSVLHAGLLYAVLLAAYYASIGGVYGTSAFHNN